MAPWHALVPLDLPLERVAACIGLVSDTHMPQRCPAWPAPLFAVLRGVDLLLHAGDVGELWVLDQLSALAPVIAVHGNDDTRAAQRELPYQQIIVRAGQRIVLTHAHYPDRAEELAARQDDAWEPKLERRAQFGQRAGAQIVVFGHTHIPMVYQYGDVLLVNPGALASGSWTTRQTRKTVALLFVRDDGTPTVVHVDLAAPERSWSPQIDWQAGFRTALNGISASILAPELGAVWPHFMAYADPLLADPNLRAALWTVLQRVGYPCWREEQEVITRDDLLQAVWAVEGLPGVMQAEIEAVLLGGTPSQRAV